AAVQAAWAALLGYWNRLHTGHGDILDFSVLDATAQVFDPGVGSRGAAPPARPRRPAPRRRLRPRRRPRPPARRAVSDLPVPRWRRARRRAVGSPMGSGARLAGAYRGVARSRIAFRLRASEASRARERSDREVVA